MKRPPITWIKEGESHFSDGFEFSIFKKEGFWILSYTDFWTAGDGSSFFVNIKKPAYSESVIYELKQYAERVIDNRPEITNKEIEL